jgi:hypothetical protein
LDREKEMRSSAHVKGLASEGSEIVHPLTRRGGEAMVTCAERIEI